MLEINYKQPFLKMSLGLTLIELLMTVALVAILAGVSIANMSKVRSPQNLVDEATDMITNSLNQANALSMNDDSSTTGHDVCSIKTGTGSSNASCDTDTSNKTWDNVNGSKFNNKVKVNVQLTMSDGSTVSSKKITYKNGLVDSKFKITIAYTSTTDISCSNTIILWPNSVIDVDKNCISTN